MQVAVRNLPEEGEKTNKQTNSEGLHFQGTKEEAPESDQGGEKEAKRAQGRVMETGVSRASGGSGPGQASSTSRRWPALFGGGGPQAPVHSCEVKAGA